MKWLIHFLFAGHLLSIFYEVESSVWPVRRVNCQKLNEVKKMTGPERMDCFMDQSRNKEGFKQCIYESQQASDGHSINRVTLQTEVLGGFDVRQAYN